jgi:hypothetical protein
MSGKNDFVVSPLVETFHYCCHYSSPFSFITSITALFRILLYAVSPSLLLEVFLPVLQLFFSICQEGTIYGSNWSISLHLPL